MGSGVDKVSANNNYSTVSFNGSVGVNAGAIGDLFGNNLVSVGNMGVEATGRLGIHCPKVEPFAEATLNAGTVIGGNIKMGCNIGLGNNSNIEVSAKGSCHLSTGQNVITTTKFTTYNNDDVSYELKQSAFINTLAGNVKYTNKFDNGLSLSAGLEAGWQEGLSITANTEPTETAIKKGEKLVPLPQHEKEGMFYATPTFGMNMPIGKHKKVEAYLDASLNEVNGGFRYTF